MKIIISGYSDDIVLIEVKDCEHEFKEELYVNEFDKLEFNNGAEVGIEYTKNGTWKFTAFNFLCERLHSCDHNAKDDSFQPTPPEGYVCYTDVIMLDDSDRFVSYKFKFAKFHNRLLDLKNAKMYFKLKDDIKLYDGEYYQLCL